MAMRLSLTYTLYTISSREKTYNIITSTKFEEGGLSSETRNDTESGDESDDDSIIPPLFSVEEMDAMDSGNESDYDHIST